MVMYLFVTFTLASSKNIHFRSNIHFAHNPHSVLVDYIEYLQLFKFLRQRENEIIILFSLNQK